MLFDIRRVKNGCAMEITLTIADGSEVEEVVYQEKYDDEVECFAEFLRYLNEEYGPTTGGQAL